MQRKTLMITPGYTIVDDGSVRKTPLETFQDGLGGALDRISMGVGDEAVVLLDERACHLLEVDLSLPALVSAGEHGWKAEKITGWTSFRNNLKKKTIVVGVLPLIEQSRIPLMVPTWRLDTVANLTRWHELTGRAWRGTPGSAGMVLMRHHKVELRTGSQILPPTWKPRVAGPEEAYEGAWDPGWVGREKAAAYEHGYDAHRMYLNGAGKCESLVPWALKRTGRVEFDPKLGGWWKVRLSQWNEPRMPAPYGPGDELERWITTPTGVLLNQLVDEGVYGGFEVIDSWTGPGKRLLRKWQEALEGVYQSTPDKVIRKTVKRVYTESVGLLNLPTNSIYRPDWHYAIIAQGRSNVWRTIWKVAKTEDRWPTRWTKTDCISYDSDLDDPDKACPQGMTIADRLGCFDTKKDGDHK